MRKAEIIKNLTVNSYSSLCACIEIHNKPNIAYRYETTAILLISAWEHILKVLISNIEGIKGVFEKDKEHTKSISACLKICENSNYIDVAVIRNIEKLIEYRDKFIHFNCRLEIEPILYALIARSIDNFLEIAKPFFQKYKIKTEALNTLPLMFKVSATPIDVAQSLVNNPTTRKELKAFLQSILETIKELNQVANPKSILYNIDVNLQSVKKSTNADLVVAIDNNAPLKVATEKVVRIVSDNSAMAVSLTDTEFYDYYSWTYSILFAEARKLDGYDCEVFKKAKSILQGDLIYGSKRQNHPKHKPSHTFYYSPKSLEIVKNMFDEHKEQLKLVI